jgi:hypothetical protein
LYFGYSLRVNCAYNVLRIGLALVS